MKFFLNLLFKKRLSYFDFVLVVAVLALFDIFGWRAFLIAIPAGIVAVLCESKLDGMKEREK